MQFEFATATRILFGAGTLAQAVPAVVKLGARLLLVTGGDPGRAALLREPLIAAGLAVVDFAVAAEPTVAMIEEGLTLARAHDCDLVVGMGGGSVLDTGKAIAALLTNPGQPLDYLEIIGGGKTIERPAAPYMAIPTTAGTGAEVTRNAVLGSPEHGVKVSLRSPLMLPRLAIVDPELTYSVPPAMTASTGLDALTQVLEPFVSRQANPLTDSLCREGLRRAARSLQVTFRDGLNSGAREDMALVSLFGGLALANAKLGAVHGIAGPLGGMIPAPHGAACAALLPHVMAVNVAALRARDPASPALQRYDEVARLVTGNVKAVAQDGVAWLEELCRQLETPSLRQFGLAAQHFPELIEKAARASSMQGNPITLEHEELHEILSRAL